MFRRLRQKILVAQFHTLHRRSLPAIEKWQKKHLQKLVSHALVNVPLYRELYGKSGISTKNIELSALPIIRKEMFLGRPAEEYVDNANPAHGWWKTTSGTSGKPFTFLTSNIANDKHYSDFSCFRFLMWEGASFRNISNTRIARIKVRAVTDENRLFIPISDFQTDPKKVLSMLMEFQPEIIESYSSILLELATLASKNKETTSLTTRYVIAFGEKLSPSARRFISDTFRCKVYDRYGIEEIGVVGIECNMHNGFHINSESVIVEIIDEKGVPLPSGERGKVVITDLFNFNMPFIRYEAGDRGILLEKPCECGLHSPRLKIEGRYSASLTLGGRRVHHLEIDAALDSFMNYVFQYQAVKISESGVVVRIVPGPGFRKEVVGNIKDSVNRLLGSATTVDVEVVKSIKPAPSGKSHILLDESVSA